MNSIKDEGYEAGKNDERIEIVRKMLDDDVDINTISKYSGLSIEEIQKLKV